MKKIIIDYEHIDIDEDIMERNSLVMNPAHQNNARFFSNQIRLGFSDDEKRMILGVVIEPDLPIFRKANEFVNEDHEVEFSKKTVEVIRNSFHKSSNIKNIRFDHEGVDVDDLIMVQSYIVGGKENPKLPEIFKGQRVNEGSWIMGYHVPNKDVWNKVKSKGFGGFSVEVQPYLNIKNFNNQKQTKMKKNKFSWNDFFNSKKVEKFEAVTADGLTVSYEGELAIDTILSVEDAEGAMSPLTNANTIITVDGKDIAIETNDEGALVAMSDVEEADGETTEAILAEFALTVRNEFAKQADLFKRQNENFEASQEEVDALKAEVADLKARVEALEGKAGDFKKQIGKRVSMKDLLAD